MSSLMRSLLPLLLVGVIAVPPAHGEEDPKPPAYYVEHLVPSEDDVPDGWKLVDESKAGSGAMKESDVAAVASGLGLDANAFYVEYRVFKGSGEKVPVAMVDVEQKVRAFHTALAEKAAAGGWAIRELGSPTRVMVIGGTSPGARKLTEALIEHCVYALTEIAMNRIRGQSGQQEAGRAAALAYTKAIEALAPKAGTAQAIIGLVHWIRARSPELAKEGKPDRGENEIAVKHFARSLKDGVVYPPKGSILVFVAGEMGGMLLTWKDAARLDEATRALELAVKHERDAKRQTQRFGNRYNLACAYARKKRIDDAFEYLEKALEVGTSMPPQYFKKEYENISQKDEDLAPLRRDGRFAELMEKYKPAGAGEEQKPEKPAKPGDSGE